MMIERIIPWVKGKKVLILGFGREGKSTWNVLKKLDCCALVDVADMAHPKEKPEGIGKWTAADDRKVRKRSWYPVPLLPYGQIPGSRYFQPEWYPFPLLLTDDRSEW